MKTINIICGRYFDFNTKKNTIGGVQTYITNLCDVILELGFNVRIFQMEEKAFVYKKNEYIQIVGIQIKQKKLIKKCQEFYDLIKKQINSDDLIIFATDCIVPNKVSGKNIAIQHGICWDIPSKKSINPVRKIISAARNSYNIIKRISKMNNIICVDYNFVNWYRTQVNKVENSMTVIPNFTKICEKIDKPLSSTTNIIFARRLWDYRGTRVFTSAIKQIIEDGYDVSVTIAGTGPDEDYMRNELGKYSNVNFIVYESDESISIHKDQHIAVVPTVGSEGTSLSLLEAMSAQCAVICTDVGGMTNIVINGYNGIMVNSGDSKQLYEAIKDLTLNKDKRQELADIGYQTVQKAFAHSVWKDSWKKVFLEILAE